MQPLTIILDTNFLLIPVQFRVDIFAEIERIFDIPYQLCILEKTITELEGIMATQKGKDKEAAKLALQLIKAKHLNILPSVSPKSVDANLLELGKTGACIATQDIGLLRLLKKSQVQSVRLRQQSHLQWLRG
ncbi:hypothetical protein HZB01_04275 [Candidatus Woesearchaeota archaeon]|nr:hypothetical protein [Candidatus Woesearchaeota archaeon]